MGGAQAPWPSTPQECASSGNGPTMLREGPSFASHCGGHAVEELWPRGAADVKALALALPQRQGRSAGFADKQPREGHERIRPQVPLSSNS
jgi:hypothetical protein